MRLTLIMIVLACTGCAHNDPWTRKDTQREVVFNLVNIADAVTTSRIQDHPNLTEGHWLANSVLGDNPSTDDTVKYFASRAVVHYLIGRSLPAKWRPYWQGFNVVEGAITIHKNCENGLC